MGLRKGQKHSGSIPAGVSLNPGGRPKTDREWKAWCIALFERPSMRSHIVRQCKKDNGLLKWIGEQAHGRPSQAIDAKIDLSIGLRAMTDQQLKAAIKEELKQLEEIGDGA